MYEQCYCKFTKYRINHSNGTDKLHFTIYIKVTKVSVHLLKNKKLIIYLSNLYNTDHLFAMNKTSK